MKNKYIVLVICLIFAFCGTYALLSDDVGVALKSSQEVQEKNLLEEEVMTQIVEDMPTEVESEVVSQEVKNHDDLEDYRILVGLVETYLGEIKSNKNPDAVELMKMVEVKKTDYITLLNSISNIKSKENISKITDLNNLRDDLLELIDQLTMLKE